jgi:hypothetical protein
VCNFPLLEKIEDTLDPKDAKGSLQDKHRIGRLGVQDVSDPYVRLRAIDAQVPVAFRFESVAAHKTPCLRLASRSIPTQAHVLAEVALPGLGVVQHLAGRAVAEDLPAVDDVTAVCDLKCLADLVVGD